MRALVVHEPGRFAVEDLPEPAPGPGEVLVAVAAAGICGSDLELVDGRRPAAYVRYPVVPGHEWSGRVVRTGPGVEEGLRPGDPVVAEGLRACGVCARCAEGRTNLCLADYAETGFTHPGAFSDFVVVPGRLVHRLPDTQPLEQAALLEPAACVIGGVLAAAPPAGARVVVIGGGTLGLLAVQLFAMHSPSELVVVGRRAGALTLAGELGATRTVRVPDEDAGWLEERADVVFEAAGNAAAVPQAIAVARRGGTVVLEGIAGQGTVAMDPDVFALKHLQVHGVFAASSRAWRDAVGLFGAGLLRLGPLITHRFALQDYTLALATLAARGSDTRKVLLVPGEGGPAG